MNTVTQDASCVSAMTDRRIYCANQPMFDDVRFPLTPTFPLSIFAAVQHSYSTGYLDMFSCVYIGSFSIAQALLSPEEPHICSSLLGSAQYPLQAKHLSNFLDSISSNDAGWMIRSFVFRFSSKNT